MPLVLTRIDEKTAGFTLADGREQEQTFGRARFVFDGGPRVPKALIDFSAIRGVKLDLNGLPVCLHTIRVESDRLTGRLQCAERHSLDLPSAPLTLTVAFKVTQFTPHAGVFDLEEFTILSVAVNKTNQ